MDAASRRPQLPALSYLDIDQAKAEEDSYQSRGVGAQSQTQSRAAAGSPLYSQPLVPPPPPPYSHSTPQQANGWSTQKPETHSAAEPHRTGADDYDNAKPMSRQSLPSISEALGVDSQPAYPSKSTVPPPVQPPAPSSPSPTFRRPYGIDGPHAHSAYGSHSSFRSFRQDSAGPPAYQPSDVPKSTPAPSHDARPPLHLQTAQPHPPFDRTDKYSTSSQSEHSSSQFSGSMGLPSVPYGYAPYSSRYAEPVPTSNPSSGPIYQPSSQYAPPQAPISPWKSDSASSRHGLEEHTAQSSTYGESVKRHLDLYDLEAALNEITNTSGIVADFSRRYSERLHQTARTTPSLSTLPSIIEVDDMMHKSHIQLDALNKIRDIIITEQAAYEQQVADQRLQAKSFREQQQRQQQQPPPPSAQLGEVHVDGEDGKGGFAGLEPKKRRGRAAPPGRCHSCNRAETPEWRRGPDGARTLCNACGLHYAKLTRKQTNANKAANAGSSNLRPKES